MRDREERNTTKVSAMSCASVVIVGRNDVAHARPSWETLRPPKSVARLAWRVNKEILNYGHHVPSHYNGCYNQTRLLISGVDMTSSGSIEEDASNEKAT